MKLTRERDATVSARILKSQLEEIDRLAGACGLSRSGMIRKLLELGIREEKLRLALDLVRERRVSVWKAAEMAGIDYREMLRALRTRNVPFPLSSEDLELELAEHQGK